VKEPQAAVVDGRIYVVGGGADDGTDPIANIYYATPAVGGDINGWITSTVPFVHPTYGQMAATYSDRLYVMGGMTPDFAPYVSPYVHFAEFNPDGSIASWTQGTEMENNLYGAAGIAFNGVLFTTGGAINGLGDASDYVGAALVDEDTGTIGTWQDTSLISPPRKWHATVRSDDDWIYVIHGNGGGSGGPMQSINRGTTTGVGEQYASAGTYTGLFDLEGLYELEELSWNTTIANPAIANITLEYRTKRDAGEAWSAWHGPYAPSSAGTVTTTQLLDGAAQFLEYRANFDTTVTDTTPILNAVQLTYVEPEYKMRLDKAAQPPSGGVVGTEEIISYTLTYSNADGGITATNTYIVDGPPKFTTYKLGSQWGPGSAGMVAGQLRWNLGQVDPGTGGEVGFSVIVSDSLPGGLVLDNSGRIFSDNGPARYSNQVTHTVVIEGPDFVVDKISPTPEEPAVGEALDLVVTVRNQGTLDADAPFWVELYIKPEGGDAPTGPSDHNQGYCDVTCNRIAYVQQLTELGAGDTYAIPFNEGLSLPSEGVYEIYAQVDVFYNNLWGLHPEESEMNNTAHIQVTTAGYEPPVDPPDDPPDGPPLIYLPVIQRGSPSP
jgi:hypothetical protein